MMDFLFGGDPGNASPDELARERELVRALKAKSAGRVPQNPWEGLNSLTEAIGGRIKENRLDKTEAAGRNAAGDKFDKLLSSKAPHLPAGPDDNGFANFAHALAGTLAPRPSGIDPALLDATADPWMSGRQRDVLKLYLNRQSRPQEAGAKVALPSGESK